MLDFVCFSINNWEKRKARKQQFMLHLSKRKDVGKVLYIEPPLNFWRLLVLPFGELKNQDSKKRWGRALRFKTALLSDKFFLFTPIFFIPFSFQFQFIYNLNLFVSLLIINIKTKKLDFKKVILWLYHPFDYPLLRWFKNRSGSVFDWAEDWPSYFVELNEKRRKEAKGLEKKLIKESDLVFAVSQKLLKSALKINKNSYQILDGTDPEIFINFNGGIPRDLKNIKRPIIAFIGTIYKRVDLDLLNNLAREMPRCSLVLIGNVFDPPAAIAKIANLGNLYFLGSKEYHELPSYMTNCDVFILPYLPNLVTSPATKIYDYLATGKPVVITDLVEMDQFKDCIKIAKSDEEFVEFVKESLQENSPQLQGQRKTIASQNSWRLRAQEIMEIIYKPYENPSD